jgi:sulfur-oxidizing protein SoxZ
MSAVWGGAISKNPYLSFKYKGVKGDSLTLSWVDNKGESDSVTAAVK